MLRLVPVVTEATRASALRLTIMVGVLWLVGSAGAFADCGIEAGTWHRGVADENNFRHIDTTPGDFCIKTQYSGFDDWNGLVKIDAPTVGQLHCGYLAIFSSPTWGFSYQTDDVVAHTDNTPPMPALPSIPCQEQFTLLLHDGGGYVTTATYFVRVGESASTTPPPPPPPAIITSTCTSSCRKSNTSRTCPTNTHCTCSCDSNGDGYCGDCQRNP
jgi:hypothetical protein